MCAALSRQARQCEEGQHQGIPRFCLLVSNQHASLCYVCTAVYCVVLQELRAAQMARALLNLPDPMHTRALALLFTPGSPYCMSDSQGAVPVGVGSGDSTAAAANSASNSSSTVLGVPASLTLRDLCKFYLQCSDSSVWGSICEIWQVAVDAMCLHLAREEGLLPQEEQPVLTVPDQGGSSTTYSSSGQAARPAAPVAAAVAAEQFSFSFESLFEGRVAGLVRKPVRVCFGLNKLLLGLDAAAGLAAARDYCERAAREFAEQAKG